MAKTINTKSKHRLPFSAATPKTVRNLNRALILDLIRQHQPLSRAELARISGIHRSNISIIVDELSQSGLIHEERAKDFGRGRTPDLISFDRSACRVMAVSLRRSHTTVAMATLAGHIDNSFTFETPDYPEQFLTAVDNAYRTLLQTANLMQVKEAPLRQVVVSIPGIVTHASVDKPMIWTPSLPHYSGTNLEAMLQKRLKLPVLMANNAGLAALSVIHDNSGALVNDFVLLVVGDVDVGSGIVLQRNLYSGYDAAFAGEIGHTVIDPKGLPCSCGRTGCWQKYICDEATWKRYEPNTPFSPILFDEFLEAVESGSPKALGALRQTAEYLSLGISNLALTFNPERIILAGALMRVWPLLHKELQSAFFLPYHHVVLQSLKTPIDTLSLRGAVEKAVGIVLSESKQSRSQKKA